MQELEKILEEMQEVKEIMLSPQNIDCFGEPCKENDCCACVINKCMEIVKKHMNDGWIPVEERLPEEKKSVLVQWEKYDRHLNVTLTYLDVMWLEDEEDVVFETINGIPNGRVIAWRPLPEPYHPERSEE